MKNFIRTISIVFASIFLISILFGFLLVACEQTPDEVDRIQSMNEVQLPEGQIQEDAAYLASFHYDLMLSDKMAEVAIANSSDSNVTNIANIILSDHKKVRSDLFAVVDRHGILLPYRLSEEAYNKVEELRKEDEMSLNRKYLQFVVEHHGEAREGVDKIIAQTNKVASIMDIARLIAAQSKIHEDMAKRYLEQINTLSDDGISYGNYSQFK